MACPPCLWLPFLFMAVALQATTHSCQCDHVVLERCCFTNKYFITSAVSQERVELPAGKHWELDFQDGLGYITSGDETFWASEFLKARPVYRRGDAWFWKEMRHPGDGQLMEAAQEHMRAIQVRYGVGSDSATAKALTGWRTHLSSMGSSYWTRLVDLVQAVGMKRPKGKPWSWIHCNAWPRWEKSLSSMGLPPSLRQSIPNPGQQSPEDHWRIMTSATISLPGLLAMLGKLAKMPLHLGGVQDPAVRTTAMHMFMGLVPRAKPPFTLGLFLGPAEWNPPRLPVDNHPVSCLVLPDGTVYVQSLVAEGSLHHATHGTLGLAYELLPAEGKVPMENLLTCLLRAKGRWKLFGHLVCSLAERLEMEFERDMQGQSTGLDPGVCMQAQDPDEFTKGEINNHLLKYMMASTALCQQVSHLALSTDDSNFGGLNRKLTAMVFPSNIGIWLAPQAFKGHKNNTPNQGRKMVLRTPGKKLYEPFYETQKQSSTRHPKHQKP